MIRTKAQLIAELQAGARLSGASLGRPSEPWSYEVKRRDGTADTVHGNAFWAAHKAGYIRQIRGSWNFGVYALQQPSKETS